jgi:hypothetical protein
MPEGREGGGWSAVMVVVSICIIIYSIAPSTACAIAAHHVRQGLGNGKLVGEFAPFVRASLVAEMVPAQIRKFGVAALAAAAAIAARIGIGIRIRIAHPHNRRVQIQIAAWIHPRQNIAEDHRPSSGRRLFRFAMELFVLFL